MPAEKLLVKMKVIAGCMECPHSSYNAWLDYWMCTGTPMRSTKFPSGPPPKGTFPSFCPLPDKVPDAG